MSHLFVLKSPIAESENELTIQFSIILEQVYNESVGSSLDNIIYKYISWSGSVCHIEHIQTESATI